MRTPDEINDEVEKLHALLKLEDRWNDQTLRILEGQADALEKRMTIKQVDDKYYIDETMEDYRDGDNDVYHEIVRAVQWANGERGVEAPSDDS